MRENIKKKFITRTLFIYYINKIILCKKKVNLIKKKIIYNKKKFN
jgi:hypothetical protein